MGYARFAGICAVMLAIGGCKPTASVDTGLSARVKERVFRDQAGPHGPKDIQIIDMWHARSDKDFSMICGEISAPPELKRFRDTLRFVDDPDTGFVQVEYHELWTGAPTSMAIIQANREVFDTLWTEHCAPFQPQWWMFWR